LWGGTKFAKGRGVKKKLRPLYDIGGEDETVYNVDLKKKSLDFQKLELFEQ